MIDKKAIYNNIGTSLNHGMIFKKGMWIYMYSLLALCLICPICTGVFFLLVSLGIETFHDGDIGLVYFSILSLLIAVGVVFTIVRKLRLKKKIYLWLDDAVERYATTIAIDKRYWLIRPATKLKVKFKYKHKNYIMYSGDPSNGNKGYYKTLSKYADRTIKILYSPSYNQVLILKD